MPKVLPNGRGCSYPPRRSGNMLAGQEPLHDIIPAIWKVILIVPDGFLKTLGKSFIRWVKKNLMLLASMICTAVFGNGVRIIGMTIMTKHLVMAVPGWIMMEARAGFCVAVRGSSMPMAAGRRTASGTSLTTGRTTSGSGLFAFQVSLVSRTSQERGLRSAESIDPSARSRRNGGRDGWGISM